MASCKKNVSHFPLSECAVPILNCLILDDSAFDRRRLTRALHKYRSTAKIHETASLQGFEELLKETKFDLVFIDFRLPIGSGFDAIRLVSELQNNPTLIWYTGDISYDWQDVCDVIGVDIFLKKSDVASFEFKEIFSAIDSSHRYCPDHANTKRLHAI